MSSKKTIKFEIVTPEQIILKENILRVTVPTKSGEITVLPNHIPLVSILHSGVIEVKKTDGSLEFIVVSGGFIEVLSGKIVILADTAQRAEEIDDAMVEEAKLRAEKLRKTTKSADNVQFVNIAAQLEKELSRIRALNKGRRLRSGK